MRPDARCEMVFGLKFCRFHFNIIFICMENAGSCVSSEANQSLLRIPKGCIAAPSYKQKQIHFSLFAFIWFHPEWNFFCLENFVLEWGWIWAMLYQRQEKNREARKRNENNVRKGAFLLPWHSIVQHNIFSFHGCFVRYLLLNNRLCEFLWKWKTLSGFVPMWVCVK